MRNLVSPNTNHRHLLTFLKKKVLCIYQWFRCLFHTWDWFLACYPGFIDYFCLADIQSKETPSYSTRQWKWGSGFLRVTPHLLFQFTWNFGRYLTRPSFDNISWFQHFIIFSLLVKRAWMTVSRVSAILCQNGAFGYLSTWLILSSHA